MERIQRIKELYREVREIHEKMNPSLIPQTVGQYREWTQEDADQYLKLHQRQGEIIKELADLERGHIYLLEVGPRLAPDFPNDRVGRSLFCGGSN